MIWLEDAIDFLTDPSGVGFPILIGGGLLLILYLMKLNTQSWNKEAKKIGDNQQRNKDRNYPYKPF